MENEGGQSSHVGAAKQDKLVPDAQVTALTVADFRSAWRIAELEPPRPDESLFDRQQRIYLAKHEGEAKPVDSGPFSFALVTRAYRELSNGNITERLRGLASQEIPTNEFKAYIAVNNLRVWAIASDVVSQAHQQLSIVDESQKPSVLKQLVTDKYKELGLEMSEAEMKEFEFDSSDSQSTWKTMEKRLGDFQENQATLRILREITTAVNTFSEQGVDKEERIKDALGRIRSFGESYLTSAQLQALVNESEVVMKKEIAVMGVDCSSASKANDVIPHAKATNEALHVAVSHRAKNLDVTDLDEFLKADSLKELGGLVVSSPTDYFIRPVQMTPYHQPQSFEATDNQWPSFLEYYSRGFTHEFQRYYYYGSQTTGTLVVSADTFRKHTYSETLNDDFDWARAVRKDPELTRTYLMNTVIIRGDRRRDVSFDGRSGAMPLGEDQAEAVRERFGERQKKEISEWYLDSNKEIEDILTSIRVDGLVPTNFLQIYEAMRKDEFEKNQNQRRNARQVFLGMKGDSTIDSEGMLAKLYKSYSDNQTASPEDIINDTALTPRQKSFFDQNSLLVPALIQEVQKMTLAEGGLPTVIAIAQFIEKTLPEIFARPLDKEPTYTSEYVEGIPNGQVNMTDWLHLYQSRDKFIRYIGNLQATGEFDKYPQAVKSALEKLEPTME